MVATGAKKPTLSELINMDDPQSVLTEVKTILALMFPKAECDLLEGVFHNIVRLFEGDYPGYRKCTTMYHDLKHATDTFMAMARLTHGAILSGQGLSREQVTLGLMCALMHDTGYIQSLDDKKGIGAKYTATDTTRSIAFMGTYLTTHGLKEKQDFSHYPDVLICTSLDTTVSELTFHSPSIALLCKLMGTADLMGQMADRTYLEKLLLLYHEFREAGVSDYTDELDLLKKTIDFYARTKARLAGELGGVSEYVRPHFRLRWHIDTNLYTKAIERNISYLTYILENHEKDYRNHLRRQDVASILDKRRR